MVYHQSKLFLGWILTKVGHLARFVLLRHVAMFLFFLFVIIQHFDKGSVFPTDTVSKKFKQPATNSRPSGPIDLPKCIWPPLDPWGPNIKGWIRDPPLYACPKIQEDMAYLDQNGVLHVDFNVMEKHNVSCFYRSIGGAFYPHPLKLLFSNYVHINQRQTKINLTQFEVACYHQRDKVKHMRTAMYRHAFMQIPPPDNEQMAEIRDSSEEELSVDIIELDSISLPLFQRHLPETLSFMEREMGFLVFKKPAKVGDNTFPNTIALLTGKRLIEPSNVHVDNISSEFADHRALEAEDFPFIWDNFTAKNCITMLQDDPVAYGRGFLWYPLDEHHGWRKPPTHYYFRQTHYYYCLHPYVGKGAILKLRDTI